MLSNLLRLENEEHHYFKELQIHEILVNNTNKFMQCLLDFYKTWSTDPQLVTLPKKQVFESIEYKGDFRLMPCIINEKEPVKSVKIIGTNEEQRTIKDKICVGKSMLIDPYDNHIFAMFDVAVLSSFRTAAISVLAYYLTNQAHEKVGIIGTGRIGFYTIYILHKWLNINNFYCNDISEQNIDNLQKLIGIYNLKINIEFTDKHAINQKCKAVFLATDSKEAFFSINNANNFQFISSVGADASNLSEIDESLLKDRSVLVDSEQSTLLGDLKKWIDKKLLTKKNITELTELLILKPNLKQNILFISTGIALQDALISKFIYDNKI